MRLGLIRRGYSATGGAEAYLKRFAEALMAAGHECVLFTSTDWPSELWPGERFVYLPGRTPQGFADAFDFAISPHGRSSNPNAACDFYFSLERVWECDCYRAGDGVHRAWLERRRSVEPFWKSWSRRLNPFENKHRELLHLEERLLAGKQPGAKAVIANSLMVKQEIVRYYGYPEDRIHVVYNGLPQRRLDPELRTQTRKRLGLTPFDYVLLFTGSGWGRKGLRYAVEGIRRANLSRPLLLVAGRGDSRAFPATERVHFLGPVRDIDPYLAAADVFILPTIYDPFSNACLEALAAGLAIITTSSNGFSEILKPGVDGEVLDDPSDTDAIARAIEGWSDFERRMAIKPHLSNLAGNLSIEKNVEATLDIIQNAKNGQFSAISSKEILLPPR